MHAQTHVRGSQRRKALNCPSLFFKNLQARALGGTGYGGMHRGAELPQSTASGNSRPSQPYSFSDGTIPGGGLDSNFVSPPPVPATPATAVNAQTSDSSWIQGTVDNLPANLRPYEMSNEQALEQLSKDAPSSTFETPDQNAKGISEGQNTQNQSINSAAGPQMSWQKRDYMTGIAAGLDPVIASYGDPKLSDYKVVYGPGASTTLLGLKAEMDHDWDHSLPVNPLSTDPTLLSDIANQQAKNDANDYGLSLNGKAYEKYSLHSMDGVPTTNKNITGIATLNPDLVDFTVTKWSPLGDVYKNDPTIQGYQANWGAMTNAEKAAAAGYVAKTAANYLYIPFNGIDYDTGAHQDNDLYALQNGKVYISDLRIDSNLQFINMISGITHEVAHLWQYQVINSFNANPSAGAAIFGSGSDNPFAQLIHDGPNSGNYIDNKIDYNAYLRQPLEVQADLAASSMYIRYMQKH